MADNAPPRSITFTLYELTFTVANATNASVFEVFEQDTENVIDVINFLIERSATNKTTAAPPKQPPQQDFWDYV